jgi:hypothetical protein
VESGQAALQKQTRASAAGSFVETGQAALKQITKTGAAGAFVLTGNAAAKAATRASGVGAFTLTGNAALKGVTKAGGVGAFTLTGKAATLTLYVAPLCDETSAVAGIAEAGCAIAGQPGPPVVEGGGGGGFFHIGAGQTKEGRRKERERLGILPKAVEKVIAQVAERKVAQPDLQLDAALHRALDRKALAYRALYAEILRQRIAQIEREDEEVALLLLM